MKRKLIMFLTLCLVLSNFFIGNVHAEDPKYSVVNTSTDVVLNEFTSYESALSNLNALKSANPSVSYGITLGNKLIKCDYAVARISGYFNYVEEICNEMGVTYIDFNKMYDELGIDFSTDMAENKKAA